jgi:hypothetical protein
VKGNISALETKINEAKKNWDRKSVPFRRE